MNKIITLCFLLVIPLTASASEFAALLELKPGAAVKKEFPTEGIAKEYSYAIVKENDTVKSVSIEFTEPQDPKKYLKPKTKGHCLIDDPESHVPIPRFFFFDQVLKRRYELTLDKKIKSILIQDMPGASQHKGCTFSSFDLKRGKK